MDLHSASHRQWRVSFGGTIDSKFWRHHSTPWKWPISLEIVAMLGSNSNVLPRMAPSGRVCLHCVGMLPDGATNSIATLMAIDTQPATERLLTAPDFNKPLTAPDFNSCLKWHRNKMGLEAREGCPL